MLSLVKRISETVWTWQTRGGFWIHARITMSNANGRTASANLLKMLKPHAVHCSERTPKSSSVYWSFCLSKERAARRVSAVKMRCNWTRCVRSRADHKWRYHDMVRSILPCLPDSKQFANKQNAPSLPPRHHTPVPVSVCDVNISLS